MSDQALNVDYARAELRYNAFMLPMVHEDTRSKQNSSCVFVSLRG